MQREREDVYEKEKGDRSEAYAREQRQGDTAYDRERRAEAREACSSGTSSISFEVTYWRPQHTASGLLLGVCGSSISATRPVPVPDLSRL